MDEQGFEFQRAPERRERPRFEPPPWEKEAFDELQRRKAEEAERAAAAAEAAAAEAAAALAAEDAESEAAPLAASGEGVEAHGEAPHVEQPEQALDEGAVIEMMAALAAEEPAVVASYHKVALATGLGLVALGAVLLIWGMAALVGSRQTGMLGQIGGVGLGMFGAFFMGMGVWLLYRTLKQRGVL